MPRNGVVRACPSFVNVIYAQRARYFQLLLRTYAKCMCVYTVHSVDGVRIAGFEPSSTSVPCANLSTVIIVDAVIALGGRATGPSAAVREGGTFSRGLSL